MLGKNLESITLAIKYMNCIELYCPFDLVLRGEKSISSILSGTNFPYFPSLTLWGLSSLPGISETFLSSIMQCPRRQHNSIQ